MVLHDLTVLTAIAHIAWSAAFAFTEAGTASAWGGAETIWQSGIGMVLVGSLVGMFTIPFILYFGLYHAIVRYMGEMEVVSIFKVALFSTAIFILFSVIFQLPREWPVSLIYWTLMLLTIGGSRFLVRHYVREFVQPIKSKVIIYGAGALGTQLLKALNVGQDYQTVAIIDDDDRLQDQVIDGVAVYSRERLPHLVYKHGASQLLVAIAGLSEGEKQAILDLVKHLPIKVRAIPRMTDLVTGKANITPVADSTMPDFKTGFRSNFQMDGENDGQSDVQSDGQSVFQKGFNERGGQSEGLSNNGAFNRWLTDFGRQAGTAGSAELAEECNQEASALARGFFGETLLVLGVSSLTGLAIARWCLRLHQGPLLLVDSAEESLMLAKSRLLHDLDAQSSTAAASTQFLKLNYFDGVSLEQLLRRFSVDRLFYCASDQQVVLNEENVVNAVQNNGLMLRNVLQAVARAGIPQFALVSSDKSIRPTSIVGATRRLQEFLVLQAAQQQMDLNAVEGRRRSCAGGGSAGEGGSRLTPKQATTRFGIVRLGNLLEDEYSVLARFRRQILQGGPVTVTHPDARRYFIGVDEAVHLLLQASQMMHNGDIFVLDMGQPVVISELARRMVHAMGLSVRDVGYPEGDIEIRYTGLRPGEKLFEESLFADNAEGTYHPRVMRATEWVDSAALDRLVDGLRLACDALDVPKIIELLERSDLGFRSGGELVDPLWLQQQALQKRRSLLRGRLKPVEV